MNHNGIHHGIGSSLDLVLVLLFLMILIIYILATVSSNRHHREWPLFRTFFWCFGVLCMTLAVVGPLAKRAHMDFTSHMFVHLLLGMLAPLLLVLAAPMTLAFRTLNVNLARYLSRFLKSRLVRILSDPTLATILNVGGSWILYTTDLYGTMQHSIILHVLVHIHVFFAGYLFTVSMINIDPSPHRTSYIYRSIVLVIAIAGHGILSKYIYNHPPSSVSIDQAELGGMIMYYGGDSIEIILIFILCLQWYRAKRPRVVEHDLPNEKNFY